MNQQPPTAEAVIEVTGLRKSYGDHVVLDGVDLTVPRGTVYALLGPNGAGKTTLVRILSTLVAPDGGSARVAGHDVADAAVAVRRSIGVTGQFSAVDDLLTGRENLRLMADLAHLPRTEASARVAGSLERFGLTDAAGRRASTYSGGMRRRLDLAMTLVSRPGVIFLDEPTTGLDPRSRRESWDIVREFARRGGDGAAHHAVPGGGGPGSPTPSACSTAAGSSPRARPPSSRSLAGGESLDDVFLALTEVAR
ncbi:ATP-binding cassette domain-containing protein [Nocardioides convexus]|uniref:ABC transporter ATP-binding protein n=1 Tax=Nocardioides convexus TaxID=2712224 RepID=UPI003100ED37